MDGESIQGRSLGSQVRVSARSEKLPIRGRFGLLRVEGSAPPAADGAVRVTCRCGCGRLAVRAVKDLQQGTALACARCRPQERGRPLPEPTRFVTPPQPDAEGAKAWLESLHADPKAVNRTLRELDRAVERYLQDRFGDTRRAHLMRRRAKAAALRRLRFMTAEDIARRVGGPDLNRSLIHQWVCRGRSVVLEVLDHWEGRTRSQAVRQRIGHLRLLMQAGRSDAGKERPWARKQKGKE